MDVVMTRVIIDEEDTIRQVKACIQLQDIVFYEEYPGTALEPVCKPILTLHLTTGDSICIIGEFKIFKRKMDTFRKSQLLGGFNIKNN